ncbi:MAG: tRNA (adenosine(37)-N6)-dimethylallyltransferase MiaA [candidate division Zixibacteria bacterium]|nr:tRNA (adenosine(37)-N6)-dimethylallyltransferase MiaA [candidate division Zixibacteria bacterium]
MDDSGENRQIPGIIPVVVIGGPTASGKSSLAIDMAMEIGAEIISADSRQLFRALQIGTARLTENEMRGIPHHLSGFIELGQRYTVFDYMRDAQRLIREIAARGRRVIVCGGTGLYLRALIDGIFEIPEDDFSYRQELIDLAAEHGPTYIHQMLSDVDPEEAARIHPNNLVKVIRALEIFHITGRPKSYWAETQTAPSPDIKFLHLILLPDRAELYKRIDAKVDEMIRQGLLEEARRVYDSSDREALRHCKIVGYSELFDSFDGQFALGSAWELIKQNTRRFAKRQYTWFRGVDRAKVLESFGNEAAPACRELISGFLAARN